MAAEVANQEVVAATVAAVEENNATSDADTVATDVTVTTVVEVGAAPKKDDGAKADEAAAAEKTVADTESAPAATPVAKVVAPKVTVHKVDFEKDVVYLYQFARTPQLPSMSPYCLKTETFLRLAGIKYQVSIHRRLVGHLP